MLESPVFDIMRIVDIFELHNVHDLIQGTKLFSKKQWSNMVWARAWSIENRDWKIRTTFFNVTKHLNVIQEGVQTLIWWQMGDMAYDLMKCFETMVKLVTRASRLKSLGMIRLTAPTAIYVNLMP